MAVSIAPPPWTLLQMVLVARTRLDDLPGDIADEDQSWPSDDSGLLWKNLELASYADEAAFEFAMRRPIKDSLTAAVCNVAVTTPTADYSYHASIQAIERARFVETVAGTEHPLQKVTHTWLDEEHPRWQQDEVGDPRYYIEDSDERRILLYPAPQLNGTLYLTVRRYPVTHLSWALKDVSTPDVPAEHHWALIDFMLYRAYLKRDAETENPGLAEAHLNAFDAKVGPRPSAHLQRVRRMERNTHRRVRGTFF